MTQKIIALHQSVEEDYSCKDCQKLAFRVERSITLHAQTANQLATTEAKLVEAKRRIRELEAQLATKANG